MNKEQIEKYSVFRRLCILNAEDALRAAEVLIGKKLNHIVYHLSVLALEEIGKVFIGFYQLTQEETWEREKINIPIDDHVKKLFFAIWGPTITQEKITKEQFEENRGFAKRLHDKRLETLYTDFIDQQVSAEKISDEEANAVYRFANATLNLSENTKTGTDLPKPTEEASWFFAASNDPIKRKFIFGNSAQEKLIEFGDINKWIVWLKERFDQEEKELQLLVENEVNRVVPSEANQIKPKWKIKIKLNASSHIIKANILAAFNKTSPYVQLYKGKDNHTLLVEFRLGDNVSITEIWNYGWLVSKFFVAALNIAMYGLFYWNAMIDLEKYYEEITDLENKKKLNARLESGLQLNWDEKMMILSEKELYLTQLVYQYVRDIQDKKNAEVISEYIAGLGLLAKNDIHSRFEPQILMHFYKAFYIAIHTNEKLDAEDNWHQIAFDQIGKMLKGREIFDEVMGLASNIKDSQPIKKPITLTEVIGMKQYCGLYLLTLAVRYYYKDNTLKLQNDPEAENEPSK